MAALKEYFSKFLVGIVLLLFLFAGMSIGMSATLDASVAQGAAAGVNVPDKLFEWRPFLAPFHSVVLHLPIGFFLIAFLLELYSLRRPSTELRRAIGFVLLLSVASAVVTISLGLLRGTSGEYDEAMLARHKWFGIAVGAISLVALAIHWMAFRTGEKRGLIWLYRIAVAANLGVLMIAGHEGGNLTHGSAYLVKNAPEFVKSIIEEFEDTATEDTLQTVANETDREFIEKIHPILEGKCFSCHGPEKQKGGYRLDQAEVALKGGDSDEVAIKPGEPMQSHLIKLILLPAEHDEVMPPSGKGTLNNDEIVTLIRWVQNGANFAGKGLPARVAALATNAAPAEAAIAPSVPIEIPKPRPIATQERIREFPKHVEFVKDIQPILEEHCLACHGSEKQKSRLRLDRKELALLGGRHGPIIVPGHAEESELYLRVSVLPDHDPAETIMPPEHKNLPLTAAEVAAIGGWINSGAVWPDGVNLSIRQVSHR